MSQDQALDRELEAEERGMPRLAKIVVALLVLLFIGSVAARALTGDAGAQSSGSTEAGAAGGTAPVIGGSASGFRAGGTPGSGPAGGGSGGRTGDSTGAPDSDWRESLPFLTEGSFFALIGFALGYTSKKIIKIGLILLACAFVLVQGLAYLDVIEVDWNSALEAANRLIWNIRENETLDRIVRHKLPTAGAFGAGWILGLKTG